MQFLINSFLIFFYGVYIIIKFEPMVLDKLLRSAVKKMKNYSNLLPSANCRRFKVFQFYILINIWL